MNLRRRALLERALAMTQSPEVTTKAQLGQRAAALARLLEVAEPSLGELRSYGERHGMHARVARLDVLG